MWVPPTNGRPSGRRKAERETAREAARDRHDEAEVGAKCGGPERSGPRRSSPGSIADTLKGSLSLGYRRP